MINVHPLYSLKLLAFISLTLLLNGCAHELFYWGKYEDSLIERYVDNENAHTETYLNELISEAEIDRLRIPPGICADYGFSLYKRGDRIGAINYFEKEKLLYPEATPFMTKLIDRVKQQNNSTTGVTQ
jgi:hypothetical protein